MLTTEAEGSPFVSAATEVQNMEHAVVVSDYFSLQLFFKIKDFLKIILMWWAVQVLNDISVSSTFCKNRYTFPTVFAILTYQMTKKFEFDLICPTLFGRARTFHFFGTFWSGHSVSLKNIFFLNKTPHFYFPLYHTIKVLSNEQNFVSSLCRPLKQSLVLFYTEGNWRTPSKNVSPGILFLYCALCNLT